MASDRTGSLRSLLDRYALDRRSLVAFRVAIGLVLLFDLAARTPDLLSFYSDAGAVPRDLVLAEHPPPPHLRLFLLTGSPVGTAVGLAVFAGFALCLTLGRFTRICTFACWLLWCSWMARNPYVLNFGDRILRVVLFWALFLPLDGRQRAVGLGALAYQLQIVAVYFVGAFHKSDPIWTNGEAVRYVLQFDQVTRPLGHALAAYPRLLEALTYATLVFEFATPLVFSPFRSAWFRGVVVLAAIAFHLGLAVTMLLGHFPAVCIAAWLPFVPGAFWEKLGWRSSASDTRLPRPAAAMTAAALSLVATYNVATLVGQGRVPGWLDAIAKPLALDQRWTMFAPHPSRIDGWFVVAGRTAEGRSVDAWSGEGVPRFAKPEDPAARYSSHRWMSYMVKMHVDRERSQQAPFLADYLCRRWNEAHDYDAIENLAIDFMQELSLPAGLEDDPIRVPITRRDCERQR